MEHVEALFETLAGRPDGLSSKETAAILGARTTKGIGSRLAEAKTSLRMVGVNWTDVVDRRRADGALRWFAGPGLERARHALSGYATRATEAVNSSYPGPVIVFRTLRIERSWDGFPNGVVDLARHLAQARPGRVHGDFAWQGEIHIERIENASPEWTAVPEGCEQHGCWVRGLYDGSPPPEATNLEAIATGRVTVEFGVGTVWEKRAALGADPRIQLAAEQAFGGIEFNDGWYPVPDLPTHRFVREMSVNGKPVKVPPELALRTRYRLSHHTNGQSEERTIEALRGDAETIVTDFIRTEHTEHNRVWFVSYDDHGHFDWVVVWPATEDKTLSLRTPPRVCGEDEDGSREWAFDNPARFEDDVVTLACELWTNDEPDRAESLLRAVLRANPHQFEAMMWLGSLIDKIGREAEAAAWFGEAVYQARSLIPDDFNWQRDRIPWGHLPNRAVHRAWGNLARIRARQGHANDAIELWEDLLRFSPNDNIGARTDLMNHLVGTDRYAQAIALAQRDRADDTPQVRLGEAIARAHRGEENLAVAAAKRALVSADGRRLATRLVNGLNPVYPIEQYEADEYCDAVRNAWKTDQGKWLRSVLEELLEI